MNRSTFTIFTIILITNNVSLIESRPQFNYPRNAFSQGFGENIQENTGFGPIKIGLAEAVGAAFNPGGTGIGTGVGVSVDTPFGFNFNEGIGSGSGTGTGSGQGVGSGFDGNAFALGNGFAG